MADAADEAGLEQLLQLACLAGQGQVEVIALSAPMTQGLLPDLGCLLSTCAHSAGSIPAGQLSKSMKAQAGWRQDDMSDALLSIAAVQISRLRVSALASKSSLTAYCMLCTVLSPALWLAASRR